jgi:hypothetical protein
MRLTVENDRETIKRYGHIKPAGVLTQKCSRTCPGTARSCTREKGHRGPHVAHGSFKRILAVWESGSAATGRAGESAESGLQLRNPGRLRHRKNPEMETWRPLQWLKAVGERLMSMVSSPEDLIFLVFFLAFVGFAIHWLILIAGG